MEVLPIHLLQLRWLQYQYGKLDLQSRVSVSLLMEYFSKSHYKISDELHLVALEDLFKINKSRGINAEQN